ncbi:MAG: hypothetical protein CL910_12255 [Deltaproteobacteria bacterium]|nr:hypothetical protein [Deltaproteobacteria bacterium]
MAEETGLFIEDLKPGLDVPGGRVGQGLEVTPEAFEARFGRLFWRADGTLDPIYFKLAAFCKTTAVSENSPANLGAKNVLFGKAPTTLDDEATTRVLGRKFREVGATTGVCQVRSTIGETLTWTRECIVNGREGFQLADDGTPLDDREKIEVDFDLAATELPPTGATATRTPGALVAGDFRPGELIPTGRISVLRPDEIFWITRGLGNLAKTHYTRDSSYIVWGLLTLLYGVYNYAQQLQCAALLGLDVARHLAPVYLTEQVREEEHAGASAPVPPEFLSSTLTTRAVTEFPGRDDLRLVTATLDVYNNVNSIGRSEYERQKAKKALGGIGEDGRLHIGEYVLQMAVFTEEATSAS